MPQGAPKGKKKDLLKGIQRRNNKPKEKKLVQRKNCPIAPKKSRNEEVQRLKKIITKNVNKAIEEQVRGIAADQRVHLSKKKEQDSNSDPNKMPPKQG